MRRLSVILVVAIIIGGLSLGSTQVSAASPRAHSSILLAQAAVQPPTGFLSGIASAIDRMVSSVIDAVKATFGFKATAPKIQVAAPTVIPSTVAPVVKSAGTAPLNAPVSAPVVVNRLVIAPPSVPVADGQGLDPEMADGLQEVTSGAGEAKPAVSLFPANSAKIGAATLPAATKPSVPARIAQPSEKKPAVTTSGLADSGVAKSAAGKDPLKLSDVSAAPAASSATVSATTAAVPVAPSAAPARTDSEPSRFAAAASPAPVARAEAPVAAQPMFYAQPVVAPSATVRTIAPETPSVRSATPVASAPVVRPVVAVPRFIDTVLPVRPAAEPVRERVAAVEESAVVVGDAATLPTRGDSLPARTEVDVRTLTPTDLPPDNPATVRPPADTGTPVVTASAPDVPRMIILNDGTQQVIIQPTAAVTSIIDPASTEAVVCRSAGDFPILSLGDDEAGITRGVVLATGTILLKPTDFFKKFVRLEGAPFAIEAPAKDCGLLAQHARLSTPDLIINMPKLSETDRELISAKSVVQDGGRVFIVAADHSADKTLRGIVVREASGRLLFKLLPERNQVAQVVRGMTVSGDLMGRMMADIVLSASDGSTSTQHCEFTKDADMTCTTRGAL